LPQEAVERVAVEPDSHRGSVRLETKLDSFPTTLLGAKYRTMTQIDTETTTVELTVGEAINRALDELFASGEPAMHLGQDIGAHGGTFGVTRGLWDKYGDEVIRDGPLCESATVGYAIGLAISGVRAVVEIEFFDFVGVAMDQIFNQAAKLHYFTGGKLAVPLVIRTPIVA